MADLIPFYEEDESVLRMGPSGGSLVLVSNAAHVVAKLENVFDDQTSVGKNFKRVRFLGIKPAHFTITFIVLPEDEKDFYDQVTPLFRQKGKKGTSPPMSVVNLQINRLGINVISIVSADIGAPDAKEGRAVTIQAKEWTPAPVKSEGGKAKAGVNARDPLNLNPGAASKNQ